MRGGNTKYSSLVKSGEFEHIFFCYEVKFIKGIFLKTNTTTSFVVVIVCMTNELLHLSSPLSSFFVTAGQEYHIITGRGNHSKDHQPKIKPKILKYLRNMNYKSVPFLFSIFFHYELEKKYGFHKNGEQALDLCRTNLQT